MDGALDIVDNLCRLNMSNRKEALRDPAAVSVAAAVVGTPINKVLQVQY